MKDRLGVAPRGGPQAQTEMDEAAGTTTESTDGHAVVTGTSTGALSEASRGEVPGLITMPSSGRCFASAYFAAVHVKQKCINKAECLTQG